MSNDKREKLIDNIDSVIQTKNYSSWKVFLTCLNQFKLSFYRRLLLSVLLLIIFLYLKFFLFTYASAFEIVLNITSMVHGVFLPIFAVIITGYAIFQALASGSTLITMLQVSHKSERSKFETYNFYFFGISIFYLIVIIFNFSISFLFHSIPNEWQFDLLSNSLNEYISAMLISLYLVILLNFLIEMKSFIYNLFQVFSTNASSAAIEFLKKEE